MHKVVSVALKTCDHYVTYICTCVCDCRQVLNEVVVDRGPSSYLSNVDLYLDGRLITSVQGDGEFTVSVCVGVCDL